MIQPLRKQMWLSILACAMGSVVAVPAAPMVVRYNGKAVAVRIL
jgi:hypothetical protein